MPGSRAVTFKPVVNLTFATCRVAEFGFLGLVVITLLTVPFTCGLAFNAGVLEKLNRRPYLLRQTAWITLANRALKDQSLPRQTQPKSRKKNTEIQQRFLPAKIRGCPRRNSSRRAE